MNFGLLIFSSSRGISRYDILRTCSNRPSYTEISYQSDLFIQSVSKIFPWSLFFFSEKKVQWSWNLKRETVSCADLRNNNPASREFDLYIANLTMVVAMPMSGLVRHVRQRVWLWPPKNVRPGRAFTDSTSLSRLISARNECRIFGFWYSATRVVILHNLSGPSSLRARKLTNNIEADYKYIQWATSGSRIRLEVAYLWVREAFGRRGHLTEAPSRILE